MSDGPQADSADTPMTPGGAGSWDTRSEEILATSALTPRAARAARSSAEKPRRTPRRGAVDPVKALMHRHRELCHRAVDPLEIAAGLEAHGVTDRTAARFRHRDVFSLAEEMYARVPRGAEPGAADAAQGPGSRVTPLPAPPAGWAALAMLPGAVCAVAVTGVQLTGGRARLVVLLVGALAVAGALRMGLRHGPLFVAGRTVPATRLWTCWLLAYALLGDGLLRGALAGGPDELWPPATAPVLGLALSVGPAAWCARLFAAQAGRRLEVSRGLAEFAAGVRPLLGGVFGLFLACLALLLVVAGAVLGEPAGLAPGVALGALLLLARLLAVYGFPDAPASALGWACGAEVLALALVLGGRLPGCGALAAPVEALASALGVGAVPTLACGGAALALLAQAARTLTRASAHAPTPTGAPR
ncbi:hypothetical protein [Streptomyces sp. NBC_01304]|uniref:hypothetical protein n=1 Tax=Streptomyces sp. NBC_01304 TaxID=2903818 RepID=UPI002E15E435|nr:hypothetical protein OG430_18280 [Streptomyces sp. NBC_01304]